MPGVLYAPDSNSLDDTYLEFEGDRTVLRNISATNGDLAPYCDQDVVVYVVYDLKGQGEDEFPLASFAPVTLECD